MVVQKIQERQEFFGDIFYWSRCMIGRAIRQAFHYKVPFFHITEEGKKKPFFPFHCDLGIKFLPGYTFGAWFDPEQMNKTFQPGT